MNFKLSELLERLEKEEGYLKVMNKARQKAHMEKDMFLNETKIRFNVRILILSFIFITTIFII